MGMILTLSNGGGDKWLEFEGRWTFESATKLLELFATAGSYAGWDVELEDDDENIWMVQADKNDEFVWVLMVEGY
jgi:hypothetical protein